MTPEDITTGRAIKPHDSESEDITLEIEMRPSTLTGISWWAVLRYKSWSADELLQHDWGALTDEAREEKMAEVAKRLSAELRPILVAEDQRKRLTVVSG